MAVHGSHEEVKSTSMNGIMNNLENLKNLEKNRIRNRFNVQNINLGKMCK